MITLLTNVSVSSVASVPESAMLEWAMASSLVKRIELETVLRLKITLLDRSFRIADFSSLMKYVELYSIHTRKGSADHELTN